MVELYMMLVGLRHQTHCPTCVIFYIRAMAKKKTVFECLFLSLPVAYINLAKEAAQALNSSLFALEDLPSERTTNERFNSIFSFFAPSLLAAQLLLASLFLLPHMFETALLVGFRSPGDYVIIGTNEQVN